MATSYPATLVEALDRLPDGDARGFRFFTLDREEKYFPYQAMRAEAARRAAFLGNLETAPMYGRAGGKLTKGDTVALVLPENHEFVLSFLGASVGGFVPVPVYPGATFKVTGHYVESLAHILVAARAKVVICNQRNLETVRMLKERPETKDVVILVAETDFLGEAPPFERPNVTPDDLCFLQFTSGSTSKPKGVMIRHRNLVANTTAFLGPSGLNRTPDDLGVSWLPLFHDMGLIGFVLGTLIVDLPVVLFRPSFVSAPPPLARATITKYKGTITYAPNFAYQLVSKRLTEKDLSRLDLSCLRVAGCGAEPIRAHAPRVRRQARARGSIRRAPPVATAWPRAASPSPSPARHRDEGSDRIDPKERCATANAVVLDAPDAHELVNCGVPFPGTSSRSSTRPAIAGGRARKVGEILTRGPSVNDGYYENAEAHGRVLQGRLAPHGRPRLHADGDVFICGPRQGPHHRPRRQPLPAGHRVGGERATRACAAATWSRSRR
jgi:fatty-acyl-CoA synthase